MNHITSWLVGKTYTAEEMEVEAQADSEERLKSLGPEAYERQRQRIPQVPFGFLNDQWEVLKARQQPGDYFQKFHSGQKSFEKMAGRAGVALVRDGVVVLALCTVMN